MHVKQWLHSHINLPWWQSSNYMVIILAGTMVTVVNVHAAVANEKCKEQAGVLQFSLA